MKSKSIFAVAAIVFAGTAAPALAQNSTTTADPYAANTAPADDDNDRDFPWGLLGLAGLAGLLGRKRNDDDHDARRTSSTSGNNNRM